MVIGLLLGTLIVLTKKKQKKKRGRKPSLSKILNFRECISYCGLVDLGFAGHPFTWNNRRFEKDFICERLDCDFATFANGA